ncbi:hypothetical protein F5146DRAFT_1199154 [Armillaria mellea]|nr:hypothetical protein F5146DRAFT_1199154 [Armillaria mellea]
MDLACHVRGSRHSLLRPPLVPANQKFSRVVSFSVPANPHNHSNDGPSYLASRKDGTRCGHSKSGSAPFIFCNCQQTRRVPGKSSDHHNIVSGALDTGTVYLLTGPEANLYSDSLSLYSMGVALRWNELSFHAFCLSLQSPPSTLSSTLWMYTYLVIQSLGSRHSDLLVPVNRFVRNYLSYCGMHIAVALPEVPFAKRIESICIAPVPERFVYRLFIIGRTNPATYRRRKLQEPPLLPILSAVTHCQQRRRCPSITTSLPRQNHQVNVCHACWASNLFAKTSFTLSVRSFRLSHCYILRPTGAPIKKLATIAPNPYINQNIDEV